MSATETIVSTDPNMSDKRGTQCCAFGCSKCKKKGARSDSDSDDSSDDESEEKKQFTRTLHLYMQV